MNIHVKEYKKISFDSSILLVGLPEIGNVGLASIDFLIDSFRAKKLASVYASFFPNVALVSDDSLISLPSADLFYYRGKKSSIPLIFLRSDSLAIDASSQYLFAKKIFSFLATQHIKEICAISGKVSEDDQGKEVTMVDLTHSNNHPGKNKIIDDFPSVVSPFLTVAKAKNLKTLTWALVDTTHTTPVTFDLEAVKICLYALKDHYNLSITKIEKKIEKIKNDMGKDYFNQDETLSETFMKQFPKNPDYIG